MVSTEYMITCNDTWHASETEFPTAIPPTHDEPDFVVVHHGQIAKAAKRAAIEKLNGSSATRKQRSMAAKTAAKSAAVAVADGGKPKPRPAKMKWTNRKTSSISCDPRTAKTITCEIDSGATAHYLTSKKGAISFNPNHQIEVRIADGQLVPSAGLGTLGGIIGQAHIVPSFTDNLLSVPKLVQDGHSVIFATDGSVSISRDGVEIACGNLNSSGLYTVDIDVSSAEANGKDCSTIISDVNMCHHAGTTPSAAQQQLIWNMHKRLLHTSARRLKRTIMHTNGHGISKDVSEGAINHVISNCASCLQMKSTAQPHRNMGGKISTTRPFEQLHFDVKGPMPVCSYGKSRYALVIVDDFTRAKYVVGLKQRNDAINVINSFVSTVVRPLGHTVSRMRSDNASEFKSAEFNSWAVDNNIQLTYSSPYASESNGIAERAIRTINTAAEVLRHAACLPQAAWMECYSTAALLERYIPRSSDGVSPHELITGRKPPYNRLKAFGCTAFINVSTKLRTALSPTSHPGVLVGYSENSNCFRILTDTTRGTIVESTDVSFNEAHFGGPIASDGFMSNDLPSPSQQADEPLPTADETSDYSERGGKHQEKRQTRSKAKIQSPHDWTKVSPSNYADDDEQVVVMDGDSADSEKPQAKAAKGVKIKDALLNEATRTAMQKEIDSITNSGGWSLVKLPRNRTAIGSTWVVKEKFINGKFERVKARICPQGFSQTEGVDYFKNQTAAPTIALASERTVFGIVACVVDCSFH